MCNNGGATTKIQWLPNDPIERIGAVSRSVCLSSSIGSIGTFICSAISIKMHAIRNHKHSVVSKPQFFYHRLFHRTVAIADHLQFKVTSKCLPKVSCRSVAALWGDEELLCFP